MKYTCTRNSKIEISASEAIVKGISDDGGLFVPSSFPIFSLDDICALCDLDYAERSAKILSKYLDDFSYEEILDYTHKAYSRFDEDVCPVVKVEDGLYMLELWHGPTASFKDISLSLLPYLLGASKKKLGIADDTLLLVATSGDAGKSAMEAFKDVEGAHVAVFYPAKGVSELQRLQMVTQEGANVSVFGVKGNFDDAQSAIKRILNDEEVLDELKNLGVSLSVANSFNWGSLAPQIVYYFSAYCDLVASEEVEPGEKINFVVPTGNFGNVVAGYYAYRMGLPVNKFIIATNANNALVDLFNDGEYDVRRDFFKTMSPSMDVLVASNLERLVYDALGRDDDAVKQAYDSLKRTGRFVLDPEDIRMDLFEAGWADEEDTKNAVETFFDLDDYIMDTHTAVGASVYNDYSCETEDETPTVIVSTASPYKVASDVLGALGTKERNAYKAVVKLYNLTALDCPESIVELEEKEEIYKDVIECTDIKQTVLDVAKRTQKQ